MLRYFCRILNEVKATFVRVFKKFYFDSMTQLFCIFFWFRNRNRNSVFRSAWCGAFNVDSFHSRRRLHLQITFPTPNVHITQTELKVTANLLGLLVPKEAGNYFYAAVIPEDTAGWRHCTPGPSRSAPGFLRLINPTIPHTPAVYSFEQESCASLVSLSGALPFVISRFGTIHRWRSHDIPQNGLVGILMFTCSFNRRE